MKLSIITINYNNISGFENTAKSIVCQTFEDYEWIVIDGGSTDGFKDVVNKYIGRIAYIVSERDRGIYNAMNKGIIKAQGEYLLFLNSGDYFFCDKTLENTFSIGFVSDFVSGKVFEKKDNKLIAVNKVDVNGFSAKDLIKSSLPHQSTFIRKVMFEKFGLYDETYKIVSDWKFFMEAIVFGGASLTFISETITIWQGGGISTTQIEENKKERLEILNSFFPPLVQKDYELVYSLSDICRKPFFKKCYALLYRIAMFFDSIHKSVIS